MSLSNLDRFIYFVFSVLTWHTLLHTVSLTDVINTIVWLLNALSLCPHIVRISYEKLHRLPHILFTKWKKSPLSEPRRVTEFILVLGDAYCYLCHCDRAYIQYGWRLCYLLHKLTNCKIKKKRVPSYWPINPKYILISETNYFLEYNHTNLHKSLASKRDREVSP